VDIGRQHRLQPLAALDMVRQSTANLSHGALQILRISWSSGDELGGGTFPTQANP
jgi:hypothetical protein